jgi:predicted nucleotidyltransferase component of viral defense system
MRLDTGARIRMNGPPDITKSDVDVWQSWIGCASRHAAARDLLLTRLVIAVPSHPFLGSELALRGGVALHHLALSRPARCCTSLEYARASGGPIGPTLDAFRDVAENAGYRVRSEVRDRPRIFLSRPAAEVLDTVRLRVDVETRETHPLQPCTRRRVTGPTGLSGAQAGVLTYETEDLLGFLLRELYRRSRSRDLFDVWTGLTHLDVDDRLVLAAFAHACTLAELGRIGRGPFLARLHRHLERPTFTRDLADLPATAERDFEPKAAARVVVTRLIDRLP